VSTPPLSQPPINRDDEHGNEAGAHELVHTELLAPEPLTNHSGTRSRPPPWPSLSDEVWIKVEVAMKDLILAVGVQRTMNQLLS
jgi:hypothetical protein